MNAFNSFVEQIPVVIDVPNLLRDLFTLKGLASQLYGALKLLMDFLSGHGAFRGGFAHLLTLRTLVKNITNTFLANEFGVKPLIREVESVLGGSVAILKRLDFLRKTQGTVFTARYGVSHYFSKSDKIIATADDIGMGSTNLWLRDASGKVSYFATARVKNSLTGLDTMLGGVSTFLAALGGGSIATFLWDLVPFSFLVDWTLGVGSFIGKYCTVQPLPGELTVLSCGTSFKKVVTGKLTLEGPQLVDGSMNYGTISLRRYDRQPGLDACLNWFKPYSALTPKQWEVLAALVIQRQ